MISSVILSSEGRTAFFPSFFSAILSKASSQSPLLVPVVFPAGSLISYWKKPFLSLPFSILQPSSELQVLVPVLLHPLGASTKTKSSSLIMFLVVAVFAVSLLYPSGVGLITALINIPFDAGMFTIFPSGSSI